MAAAINSNRSLDFWSEYSKVFTRKSNQLPPLFPSRTNLTLETITITEEQVRSKLLSIDPFKPAGPDNIHPIVLKEKASEITPILTNFFNKYIQAGTIPSHWKLAHINPKYKKRQQEKPCQLPPNQSYL
ncbi:hypothetical protein CAPTEDRAFT_196091 [Capitella teleta]|uniref:Reverse transcriptase domain-containing protein n=1 Tax=Capitella teleta TaxID=283909 RepID=R7TU54_CAPTE|nr:hypothetical protein CAPTEDRAFT_196091 [Capitella teleta]|eukprot:ELT97204.1 hypothetical protein CAPTEDRAFT_196091 [Capitella teleta]